jgi:DNA-binding CsgD family transcriptional regulator
VVPGRTGLAARLVGREIELGRLDELLEAGGPRVAFVGGEAGIGKTRLVREWRAGRTDLRTTLAGWADAGSSGQPFAAFRSLVESVVGAWDSVPDPLGARAPDLGHLLAPVAPSLAVSGPPPGRDAATRAAVALLRHLTAGGRSVVLVEDLHWSDDETVAVLDRFAAGLPDGDRALVITYRDAELAAHHPAAELFRRLERRQPVAHLRLAPFTRAEVADFVRQVTGHDIGHRRTEQLYARTGGNPFFVEELLNAGAAGDEVPATVPWTLAEAIRVQLDDLTPVARRLADAASVLGPSIDFDLLVSVADLGEAEAIAALRQLIDAGMLVETETDAFRFRHDLVRETVLDGLLGRERRRLHERALDALEQADVLDDSQRVRHAVGAGRRDDVVAWAKEGASQALDRGSTWAAYEMATEGLEVACDDEDLLELAARSGWLLGLRREARSHTEQWAEIARGRADDAAEARALGLAARLAWEQGDEAALSGTVDQLCELVDRLPTGAVRARAVAQLAQHHMLTGGPEAEDWARRALDEADAAGAKGVRASALVELGTVLANDWTRQTEGGQLLRAAADEAEAIEDWVTVTRAIFNLVGCGWAEGLVYEAVMARYQRAIDRAGFESVLHAPREVAATLARVLALRPQWEAAVAEEPNMVEWASLDSVDLALESGEVAEARRLLDAVQLTGEVSEVVHMSFGARLAALEGQPAEAVALLIDVAALEKPHVLPEALRDVVEAGATVADLDAIAAAACGRWQPYVRAWRASVAADWEAAAAAWQVVVDLVDERRPRYVEADAYVELARAHHHLGDADAATQAHRRAVDLLSSWPGRRRDAAGRYREPAARLSGPDARPDVEAVPTPDDLTPREREVAQLLAEGCTNAQVATRLGIATKTAAVHVSNILAKLGMQSRTEVATWWIRESA